jgi:hypothetical protein
MEGKKNYLRKDIGVNKDCLVAKKKRGGTKGARVLRVLECLCWLEKEGTKGAGY